MQSEREITFADLTRALDTTDPQLADLVVRYLEQSDPPENASEEPDDPGVDDGEPPPLPQDAWTLAKLKQTVFGYQMGSKTPTERKVTRREAWEGLLAARHPPPRLRLATLLTALYEQGDEEGRAALIAIFRRAKLGWGIWKAFKTIYKLVEERHDAELFGVLAWRLDAFSSTPRVPGEVSTGTFIYLRRRAWRYLRYLGQTVPELFPLFAGQVLRHYPRGASFYGSWIAHQIWARKDLVGESTPPYAAGPPPAKQLKKRAFHESWKVSAEPLMRLLEDAEADPVCQFAIHGLKADFSERLSNVEAAWLSRLGDKRLASVDSFIVDLLNDSPALHQSKLAGLGLEPLVLRLLLSESSAARSYAIAYVKDHAGPIETDELMTLVLQGAREVAELAMSRLAQKTPQELGLGRLARLLQASAGEKTAAEKIRQGFKPNDLAPEQFIALYAGGSSSKKFVVDWFKEAQTPIPAPLFTALLDAPEGDSYYVRREALKELSKRKGDEIGGEWIKKAALDPRYADEIGRWLRAGKLKGEALDVEWVKGLVLRPSTRPLALTLLGNRKLVELSRIGLPWLLALARQADETLHQFAHRYLLEHVAPEDFAAEAGAGSGAESAGVDKLWALAAGAKQPEPVREFAATYLKLHHPEIGPTMAEARSYGIKPRLKHEAYSLERARPCLFDHRADVRRLAVAVARQELLRWGDRELPFAAADSRYREPRGLAAEVLLSIDSEETSGHGDEADAKLIPDASWLVAPKVFALAESAHKATREIALTLVRRHYRSLGGAEKLAWLMESPDREVRLAAVRLLWEKHRPVSIPGGWQPKKGKAPQLPGPQERFSSTAALRQFVRTVLFGLPPGRLERRDPQAVPSGAGALPDRPLPASVAKKRLIGVVRDMAEEDVEFAELVVPVLGEFTASMAKGEWHGCVAALARIRQAHPELSVDLPLGTQQTV
jgi:hypothetical protein